MRQFEWEVDALLYRGLYVDLPAGDSTCLPGNGRSPIPNILRFESGCPLQLFQVLRAAMLPFLFTGALEKHFFVRSPSPGPKNPANSVQEDCKDARKIEKVVDAAWR